MTKKQMGYFIPAILLAIILAVVVWLFIGAFITKNDISLDIAFSGSIASIAAVILALISIGVSVKEPDICIFLGDKTTTDSGTLQNIGIKNEGNAMGNMASVFIEIEVDRDCLISFSGSDGLPFNQTKKDFPIQYRFDNPKEPMPLYPGKYISHSLGYLINAFDSQQQIKFSVQVVGSQGCKKKKFDISI
jgi:hypothetical protein